MKKVLAAILVLVMAMSMAACGSESDEADYVTFASYEGDYEVTAPADWIYTPGEEVPGIDLIIGSPLDDASFMIFDEMKMDYSLTADEYYDALVQMTAYDINTVPEDEVELEESKSLTVNGLETKACEFYYNDGETGLNMRFMMHFFETEDCYVRVVCAAKVSEFENFRPMFEEMVESIVVK